MGRSKVVQRANSLADPRHLLRFMKSQAPGASIEAIAKAEGVSVATIRHSISMVETFHAKNTTGEMEYAIRDVVISAAPKVKETITKLLDATELVEIVDPKSGKKKVREVEDKTTRLEATRVWNSLVIGLQPKTPQVVNNVNQTNQIANLSTAETTEERLERLRKKAQEANLLPAEVVGVPMHIDREEDAPDEEDDDEEEEE